MNDSTLTIGQIAAQAGDSSASTASAGHLPVEIRTATGKVRKVTAAHFDGHTLVLVTGK